MKEEIVLPTKYLLLLLVIFLSVITSAIIFLYKNQLKYNKEMKIFLEKNIKGIIVELDDLSRGTYSIKINSEGLIYETPSLPMAFEVEKYNIQIGDSISKEANSNIMTFHKKKNGTFEKCCDYEIGM